MNQNQTILRDFFENILLENLDYEDFKLIQGKITESAFGSGDYVETFCEYFELGNGFAEKMDLVDFPFLKWWNEYCEEFERECEQNSREELEQLDDYYRMIGAK